MITLDNKKIYAYDIEIFPNFFSAIFKDVNGNHQEIFIISDTQNDLSELQKFLTQIDILVGFNSLHYDDIILQYLVETKHDKTINNRLYDLSFAIINDNERTEQENEFIKRLKYTDKHWSSIDLMYLHKKNTNVNSLKQMAINIDWHWIKDLPLPFHAKLSEDDIQNVIDYNINDVEITKALYWKSKNMIDMRVELSNLYGLDLLTLNDSAIANKLLNKLYAEKTDLDYREFKDKRTIHKQIKLSDCIESDFVFDDGELSQVLERLKDTIIEPDKKNHSTFKERVYFDGVWYQLGVGGLHSEDNPSKFKSDDEYLLVDADVASYYPSIMLNRNLYPLHLGKEFLELFRDITNERLQAKALGDKVKSYGLKIVINSIFGKSNFKYYWLYDPKVMLSVTLSGQLYLLRLIEMLAAKGIQTISANTDGIVCKVSRNQLLQYEQICKDWQANTGYQLEFNYYDTYIRKDVNNYLAVDQSKKIKTKGIFSLECDLMGKYNKPIVAKALHAYFLNGQDVESFVLGSNNILDFCESYKAHYKFTLYQDKLSEDKTQLVSEQLQKNNRIYVTNRQSIIYKTDENRRINIHSGLCTDTVNWLDEIKPIEDYKVNYQYYIDEIYKIIDSIEPKQMRLL